MQPKTTDQLRAIFGLAKSRGVEMDDDTKAALSLRASKDRTDRLSMLSFDEANVLIKHLGGDPIPQSQIANGKSQIPRRTLNHRKQKTGVVTLASPGHLAKMDRLAADRGMSREGLERMCLRMLKTKRPRTAVAVNAVIEALKSMNKRDNARRAA